jgi:hypothetical protein
VPRLVCLGNLPPLLFGSLILEWSIFNIILRRSKRKAKPKTIWEEKGAPSAASDSKITKKNARTEPKTALKPIPIGRLQDAVELDEKSLPELPTYKPPLELRFGREIQKIKANEVNDAFEGL